MLTYFDNTGHFRPAWSRVLPSTLPSITLLTVKDPHGRLTYAACALMVASHHASEAHSQLADAALAEYGDGDGVPISGCYRRHFPEQVKDRLRYLAHRIGLMLDESQVLWRRAGRPDTSWRAQYGRHRADWQREADTST